MSSIESLKELMHTCVELGYIRAQVAMSPSSDRIRKKDAENLENKMACLRSRLKKKQNIMNVLVTSCPMKRTPYAERLVPRNITLDEIVDDRATPRL